MAATSTTRCLAAVAWRLASMVADPSTAVPQGRGADSHGCPAEPAAPQEFPEAVDRTRRRHACAVN
jgi:hypothetical protein